MIGLERRLDSLRKQRKQRRGISEYLWELDIQGALAEVAVAKALKLPYSLNTAEPGRFDVGGLQVRSITQRYHKLILHEDDCDTDYFVLVYCNPPSFLLCGKALGAFGKRPLFWKEYVPGRPAYFVPQEQLTKIR